MYKTHMLHEHDMKVQITDIRKEQEKETEKHAKRDIAYHSIRAYIHSHHTHRTHTKHTHLQTYKQKYILS